MVKQPNLINLSPDNLNLLNGFLWQEGTTKLYGESFFSPHCHSGRYLIYRNTHRISHIVSGVSHFGLLLVTQHARKHKHRSIYTRAYGPICVCSSVRPTIHHSIYPSIILSIHLSLYLSTYHLSNHI